MSKAVKKPKEYAVIKVPEDCEDVGKFVSKEAEKAGIRLDITTYYADGRRWITKVGLKSDEAQTAKRGSVVVCKISQYGSKYPEAIDVMGQEEFDKNFKPVDDPAKGFSTTVNVDTKPLLAKLNEIKTEMSTKIEGVTLPDHENVPHVRIEFDDVNDVPHVWIDGKQVDSQPNNALVSVNLIWHTQDQVIEHGQQNQYKIECLDLDHNKRIGIAQGNWFSDELFKREKKGED